MSPAPAQPPSCQSCILDRWAPFTVGIFTAIFVEPGVLDANVLTYAVNVDSTQYAASRALLEAASDRAVTVYVTSQILCESYSLITNLLHMRAFAEAWPEESIVQQAVG